MAASNVLQTDRIKLDVGGGQFHVSRSVLLTERNSLLDSLFSGRFRVDMQTDGSLFIDRYANGRLHVNLFCVTHATHMQ